MSQTEMDAMMYKIEGEDLYLIGTSEHSMIGKFIDQIIPEESLPQTLTSYSPCFRKEKGAHGIEERGVYRIHQFEKQEQTSKYFCWRGDQASMSQDFTFRSARSPEQHSSWRTGISRERNSSTE